MIPEIPCFHSYCLYSCLLSPASKINPKLSRCSKLIAIKLCAISEMHAKVRRESVAGYATDETLACGPKEYTRWWQRYRVHLQVLLYRLILNSYLSVGFQQLLGMKGDVHRAGRLPPGPVAFLFFASVAPHASPGHACGHCRFAGGAPVGVPV